MVGYRVGVLLSTSPWVATEYARLTMYAFVCVCMFILRNIQFTPQQLSAELKNRPGVKGAIVWPEDQRLRRRRKAGRRRYQEVLLLENFCLFLVIRPPTKPAT